MWKKLLLSNETYFLHCFTNSNSAIICILYGLDGCWCDTVSPGELQDKVQTLNKRLEWNENIRNILLNGHIEGAALEKQHDINAKKVTSCILKLKYRTEEQSLRYEWHVTRQSSKEFQQNFISPLLFTLDYFGQQIEFLTNVLRKKDEEIRQYKREGFKLHRKTLATKPFNFNEFNENYTASMNTQDFRNLVSMLKAETGYNIAQKKDVKNVLESTPLHKVNHKISPKKRRRMMLQMKLEKRKQIFDSVKILQYESQSSQSTIGKNSQEDLRVSEALDTKVIPVEIKEDESLTINERSVKDSYLKDNDVLLNESSTDENITNLQYMSCKLQAIKRELSELDRIQVCIKKTKRNTF